jgi:hypothetical protein
VFSAVLVVCLAILFRAQLGNGFEVLLGDRYDGVIATAILEHWLNVFKGKAHWAEVGYFFPYTHTIAYTDGYFLVGVLYTPFRLLGLDPFLATEMANLALKVIGFGGMYALCRRAFVLPFFWSLLAAVLFTMNNGMTIRAWRIQLATVAFAPVLALCAWQMLTAFGAGRARAARWWGCAAGLLYGAWCLTCFYMAWFFTLFFAALALAVIVLGRRRALVWLKNLVANHYGSLLLILAVTVLALLPFVYVYLPKTNEVGVRAFEEVFANLVELAGVLQVGRENWLFGSLYNQVLKDFVPSYVAQGEYYNTGFNILLFGAFLFGLVQLFRRAQRTHAHLVWHALALASLLTWGLLLRVNKYTGWYWVYHYFPGAQALRVVSTYQIFLALPVVLIAMKGLALSRPRWPLALGLALLLAAAELNTSYLNLHRHAELARIVLPSAPPAGCQAFYVTGWRAELNSVYAHNVTAMMLAQATGLPTLNGVASFNPRDWQFDHPNRPDYEARVFGYALNHYLQPLCRFEPNSKQWSLVKVPAKVPVVASTTVAFKDAAWPGIVAGTQGLSAAEAWGRWSNSERVVIEFEEPLPARFSVYMVAQAFGPNAGKAFVAHVGNQSARFALDHAPGDILLDFENPEGARRLEIDVPQPVSATSLGVGRDERRLGIGLTQLQITPR